MATVNVFFSVLALATNVALVAVLVSMGMPQLRRRYARRIAAGALPLSAIVATVSMLGSLYYSEVVGFQPCRLCWYQRGAMYPLAILLLVAVARRRPQWWRFGLPVAVVGAVLSAYHYLIQHYPWLAWEATCSADTPCTVAEVWQFGFMSLAYMAGSAFLLIAALLWFGTRRATASGTRRFAPGNRDAGGLATATLAAAGIAAALFASTPQDPAQLEPAAAATVVDIVGDALPPFESADNDPAVGSQVPEISGVDYEGTQVAITGDGRPKVLLVLAHWCPHCQAEVPVVQQWLDENGPPAAVDLYSISSGVDPAAPNYPPEAWFEREGWTIPVIADDAGASAAEALGLTSYPYFVFVGADGTVQGRHSGRLEAEQLTAAVEELEASP